MSASASETQKTSSQNHMSEAESKSTDSLVRDREEWDLASLDFDLAPDYLFADEIYSDQEWLAKWLEKILSTTDG